ncbi:MAG: UDP-N-acetylmuramate dehydrogenase [Methylococcus sp.]
MILPPEPDALDEIRGELRQNEPMAQHNSWRAGGRAERFFMPADLDDLRVFLKRLPPDEELLWVGLGSNLLVRDGGIRGTVICTCNRLRQMSVLASGRLEVQAGVPCAHVAKFCAERDLTGGEFLAGIPGTMGGALAMNAGAFGGETWRLVRQVTTVNRSGELRQRMPEDYEVGYRSVRGPMDEWFVGCQLEFEKGDGAESRNRIRGLLARRSETQPTQMPSCGSVFRNPEGDFSARLIEISGLKGHTIGGAQVSEKHANFIVNTGHASAADIEALMLHVKAEVFNRQGVELIPEVKIVGMALEESR